MAGTAMRAYGRGLLFLVITVAVALVLPPEARLGFLALLLAATAGIYLGFAWMDNRSRAVRMEGLAFVVFLAVSLVGLVWSPWVLALGWFAHIGWDLAHHPRAVDTEIPRWVPPFCMVYDAGVGLLILYWWPPL